MFLITYKSTITLNNHNLKTLKINNLTLYYNKIYHSIQKNKIFIFKGFIYNKEELNEKLKISDIENDIKLIEFLYNKYKENMFDLILGDWFISIYDIEKDEILFAQSHSSFISIYYYSDIEYILLSDSLELMLSNNIIKPEINYQHIINIQLHNIPYQYNETPYKNIKRLNPAHYIKIDKNRFLRKRYWFPEKLPKFKNIDKNKAVEELRKIFFEAVRCRIKGKNKISSMLSGGLDSSSVSIVSSILLSNENKTLNTFSHIPESDVKSESILKNRISNEKIYIDKMLSMYPKIKSNFIDSKNKSILEGNEKFFNLTNELPFVGVSYWLVDIFEKIKNAEFDVLLTGDMGNATISYKGELNKLDIITFYNYFGLKNTIKTKIIKPLLFYKLTRPTYDFLIRKKYSSRYINIKLINNYDLIKNRYIKSKKLKNAKIYLTKPGFYPRANIMGAFSTGLDLNITDPTSDKRVIEYIYQLPNELFISEKGEEKDIIKLMMRDIMPKEVLHQKTRGQQASDISERVLKDTDKIEQLIKDFYINDFKFKFFNKEILLEDLEKIKQKKLDFISLSSFLQTIAHIQFINYAKEKYEQPN